MVRNGGAMMSVVPHVPHWCAVANDTELNGLGTKSGSREVFREADIPLPDGFEHLRDAEDIAEAIVELKRRDPRLRRVAVKLDEGFSGEGNAVFRYDGAPGGRNLESWVRNELPGASSSRRRTRRGSATATSSRRWAGSWSAGWRGER